MTPRITRIDDQIQEALNEAHALDELNNPTARVQTRPVQTCVITNDTVFEGVHSTLAQQLQFIFSCVGLCRNRRQIFQENLRFQYERQINYQSSVLNYDAKVSRSFNQIQEKADFSTEPQFSVNKTHTFIDLLTKKECSLITSASLPSSYTYFIQQYTSSKPLLCLDLDETLISSQFKQGGDEDFSIQVTVQNQDHVYSVIKRPGLDDFLLSLAELFELAVFTYSIKPYADEIIKRIDQHSLIKYRFYREHCVRYRINDNQFVIVKDLTKVGVPLDRILLIDNSKSAGLWQPNNFVLIESFVGDRNDRHLDAILPQLLRLGSVPSIYKEGEKENKQ